MKLFGTEPNKDILISFLNAVLQDKRNTIIDLNYLNTKKFGPYYGDGNFIIDVFCTTMNNEHFIVEIQNQKKKLCYLDEQPKALTEQIFNKFFQEAKIEQLTPEENFAYFQSRMHYWDNRNTLAYAYEKGRILGIKKGIAQTMLSMGMDKEVILQVTGLTETELHDINSEGGIRKAE